jgi:hypothetical protein
VITDAFNVAVRGIAIVQSSDGTVSAGVTTTLAGGSYGTADGQGTFSQFSGNAFSGGPNGLVVNSRNEILVADSQSIRVISNGYSSKLAGNVAPWNLELVGTYAYFNGSNLLTLDSSGVVYMTEAYTHTVRSISPQALVTTIAGSGSSGSDNGIGTSAKFSSPTGIAIDSIGSSIYIGDQYNHVIRR